jgi:ferredoxin--NADP+ reductase
MEIKTKPIYTSKVYESKIISIEHLTPSAFLIIFEKPEFNFLAGQHIIVSLEGDIHDREYSICSSENDSNMQIIVKEVDGGYFTPQLKMLKKGDILKIRGPHGRFYLDYFNVENKDIILIASGTGIAPFRSMILSYPELKFQLIHGIKTIDESYFKGDFKCPYITCTSKDSKGDYAGRVTQYIESLNFNSNALFYLCGNFNMIYDVQNLIISKGHSVNSIFTEVYF